MIVPEHAGRDPLGRDVGLVFVQDLRELTNVNLPPRPFVFFIGADTRESVPEPLFGIARHVLAAGAVYVLCWGPGCERVEDVVDEAVVGDAGEEPFGRIMTTSHAHETLCEALEFATSVAIPDESFASACSHVLVAFAGNVNWYNEAQNCLEDLLA
jgi:hypothetical protein